MKNIKTIAFAIMAFFAANVVMPEVANAAPQTQKSSVKKQQAKKPVVKKKKTTKKRRFTEAAPVATTSQRAECFNRADHSAAAFFTCESMIDSPAIKAFASSKTSSETHQASNYRPAKTHIISEAAKLNGLHERTDRSKLADYLSDDSKNPVDPLRTPWCAAFANAVLRRSGYEGTNSLMARSFLNYGQKTTQPKEGDIVVLKRGRSNVTAHVGFFDGYEWYGSQLYVKVIGGNQNNAVNVAYFPAYQVLGYRVPV